MQPTRGPPVESQIDYCRIRQFLFRRNECDGGHGPIGDGTRESPIRSNRRLAIRLGAAIAVMSLLGRGCDSIHRRDAEIGSARGAPLCGRGRLVPVLFERRRCKGRVSFCEVWNDPDSKQLLDPVDPAAYTALVKAAYPAIKITDQSPIVVRGVVVAVVSGAQLAMNPARMYVAP